MRRTDLVFALLAACACAVEAPGGPVPAALEPAAGYVGVATDVVVRGSRFHLRAEQDLQAGGSRVEGRFRAWLGAVELEQVERLDAHTLRARVPAGVAPGVTDLVVEGPLGRGTLAGAWTSLAAPAALAATASAPRRPVTVGETVEVTLAVSNAGDAAADAVPALALGGTALAELVEAPAPAAIPGRGSATFAWRLRTTGPGTLVATARVEATDVTSGAPLSAAAEAPAILVQTPPSLAATALPSRTAISLGQTLTVALVVSNSGAAAAEVTPAVETSGTGLVVAEGSPAPALVPGGESRTFTWTFASLGSGTVGFALTAAGLDVNSGTPVAPASAAAEVRVERPAALAATATMSPVEVSTSQLATLTFVVANTGEAAADVSPALAFSGPVALASAPPPAPQRIAGGASLTLRWTFQAAGPGEATFAPRVDGIDVNGAGAVSASAAAALSVVEPASLLAALDATPALLNRDGELVLALTVRNAGTATARNVTPSSPVIAGTGATTLLTSPQPASVEVTAGETATFRWTYRATAPGTLTFAAFASGTDANSGAAVTSATSTSPPVTVEEPARLAVRIVSGPAFAFVGDRVEVVAEVRNEGQVTADAVTTSFVVGPAAALIAVGAPPEPRSIAGGGTVTVRAIFDAAAPAAAATLDVTAAGADARDGRRTESTARHVMRIADGGVQLASDPFDLDGTSFAQLAAYRGRVWLGPNRSGNRLVRLKPDGSGKEVLPLAIHQDVVSTGTVHDNEAAAANRTYGSFGFSGCNPDSTVSPCGPDNEDGRGLFTSIVSGGEEWLLVGAGRASGDLDYVYLTRDAPPATPSFSYVDLDGFLGGNTRGITAAHAVDGRVYLGFADSGGSRPYGIALEVLPGVPGLDATTSAVPRHATDLRLDEAFKAAAGSFASIAMIDTFAELNGRLYAFNNVGCIVARKAVPSLPADFAGCSPPASSSYSASQSLQPFRQADIEPREKAWPQAATWNGQLYATRNTHSASQLWACNPAVSGDLLACEPGEWRLVASFSTTTGDDDETFGPPATLLVATPRYLYLGLEYSSGVRLYRSTVDAPSTKSHFTGQNACAAGTSGCQGLFGNGLTGLTGGAVLTRFLDAKALALDGSTDLYFTARAGAGAVRLLRVDGG